MDAAADRTQTRHDRMDPARARALQAALGQEPVLADGDPLPPFAHHLYFWEALPPADLGRDGHPATGGFIPDLGLPRRMWAAGRLTFHAPLRAGVRAEKTSVIEAVTRKDGRSGRLAFVRLRHDIRQRRQLCVTEWQDLVYRPDGAPAAEAAAAPDRAEHGETRRFDPVLLFRYSALTFNGHRIHYDADYARQVEGYDGLVVHGPLLAHLLMDLAERQIGPLTGFTYRARSPVTVDEEVTLCRSGDELWVRGADGRICMDAKAG